MQMSYRVVPHCPKRKKYTQSSVHQHSVFALAGNGIFSVGNDVIRIRGKVTKKNHALACIYHTGTLLSPLAVPLHQVTRGNSPVRFCCPQPSSPLTPCPALQAQMS